MVGIQARMKTKWQRRRGTVGVGVINVDRWARGAGGGWAQNVSSVVWVGKHVGAARPVARGRSSGGTATLNASTPVPAR